MLRRFRFYLDSLTRQMSRAFRRYFFQTYGPQLIYGLAKTWQVEKRYHPEARRLMDEKAPVIFALWHGQMFGAIHGMDRQQVAFLIRDNTDGDIMTYLAKVAGFEHFVRGALGKSGEHAGLGIIRALVKEHHSLFVTVDGPLGPGFVVKPGVLRLASLAQVPIIPFTATCDRRLPGFERMWDQFCIPQKGAHVLLHYGEPIHVPPKRCPDKQSQEQQELISLQMMLQERLTIT